MIIRSRIRWPGPVSGGALRRVIKLLSLCGITLHEITRSLTGRMMGGVVVSIEWLKKQMSLFSPPITSIQWNPLCLAESQKKVQQLLTLACDSPTHLAHETDVQSIFKEQTLNNKETNKKKVIQVIVSQVQSLKHPRQSLRSFIFLVQRHSDSAWTLDTQEHLYHEVDVAVLPAEILHELLEPTLLPTHLQHIHVEQRRIRWAWVNPTHLLVLLIVFHDSWCWSGWSPARLSSDDRPEKMKHFRDVCSVLYTHGGSVRTQNTDYKNNITTILPTACLDFTFLCTEITHAPQRTCDLDVVCVSVHLLKSSFLKSLPRVCTQA